MFIKLAEPSNKKMNKKIIITAAAFGFLAVIFGAFGAHSLKKLISVEQLEVWQTAVQYHFYHTLVILFLTCFKNLFRRWVIKYGLFYFIIYIIIIFNGYFYLLNNISFKIIKNIFKPIFTIYI